MAFHQSAIPLMEQYFGQELTQVKQIKLHLRYDPTIIQASINFCMNWLTSEERDPAEPRLLKVISGHENDQQICMAVRQVIF